MRSGSVGGARRPRRGRLVAARSRRPRVASLGAAARLLLLAALATGCGLLLDFDPPDRDSEMLECFATVRSSADGTEVDISSITHPDFMASRQFFTCTGGACPGDPCGWETRADAEAAWERWVEERIDQVVAGGAPGSVFNLHPGPWCVVEGSLRCAEAGEHTEAPRCDGPIAAATPCRVPALPPTCCIEVGCPDTPCGEIDFGFVDTGTSAGPRTVTVANCGTGDVRVQIDEMLTVTGMQGDFSIANGCGSRSPDEATFGRLLEPVPGDSWCDFDVTFEPMAHFRHRAEKLFRVCDAEQRIGLHGFAVGGGLVHDAPPDPLCFAVGDAPCTAPLEIHLSNGGPSPVIVVDILAPGNYRTTPAPADLPITIDVGATLDVGIRWCAGGMDIRSGTVVIVTSERRIVVEVETLAACP